MASNILSRFLPSNPSGRSIYEELRAHDEASDPDIEERAGLALDEANLRFHDDELGTGEAFRGEDSQITLESTTFLPGQHHGTSKAREGSSQRTHSKAVTRSPRLIYEDGDEDVPASLLIEGNQNPSPMPRNQPRARQPNNQKRQSAIPGPSTREARAQWETAQVHQRLHGEDTPHTPGGPQPLRPTSGLLTGSPRDQAMWTWVNVINVDNFIGDVYDYYTGSGIWCILLGKTIDLFTLIFVAAFSIFLTQCIDFGKIPSSKSLPEITDPQCIKDMSMMPSIAIWLFTFYIIWRVCQLLASIPHLMRIHNFYLYLLEIPDSDMQTVSWQDVVVRIMGLRDSNPVTVDKISPSNRRFLGTQSKERLDAHDIANRLMRKENYLIALFNKEILDLTLPIPFLRGRQLFSRTLQWNIQWCILDYVFDEHGHVKQLILKDSHRRQLSDALRTRFLFAGVMNVICAPVIVVYLMIVYFLRYFNEYQKNPSKLGSRQYTPLAEWKFREFNEVHHLFHERINSSYPWASHYLDQFPKIKLVLVARFIAFVAGAIVSVLAVASLVDPELFLGFEITHDRTVLFYIGIFGSLWAVMNGMIPEENLVFDPEYALNRVISCTHYQPKHWEDRLHSDEVRREFALLYQLKITIFLEEVLSIIITPFILWFSLPKCSDQIIDFFREFTIHVDGVGYVCSFAVFDFKNGHGKAPTQDNDVRDDYYAPKHGKMAASYYNFLDNYVLNPKTGLPGKPRSGMRQPFNPPPAFPGLMSPTLAADMRGSRMGRSERRPRSRAPPGVGLQSARTPRFAPTAIHASPMPSILLDPHHQPSTSGFGGPSVRRSSRSRYKARPDIIEEPVEGEDEAGAGRSNQHSHDIDESDAGLDESKWETSPARTMANLEVEEGGGDDGDSGVLGLLYKFQKAQTDGRPGII